MADRISEDLLPAIYRLLKQASALESSRSVDFPRVARRPAFQRESWQLAIGDFLRWSGTTLDPMGGDSVWQLLLCHGRPGALALYRAFREFLIARGGPAEQARVRLEAVAVVVKMAAHWLHEIDWDIDDAEGIKPQDFGAGEPQRLIVSLSSELSVRLRRTLAENPGFGPPLDFVETAIAERLTSVEQGTAKRFPPRQNENNPIRDEGRGGAPEPASPQRSAGPAPRSLWINSSDSEPSATPPFPSKPKFPLEGL